MKPRVSRMEQLRRIDAWLTQFRTRAPILFGLFCLGISVCIAGVVLKVLEWSGL
jgi:hypothetical protein